MHIPIIIICLSERSRKLIQSAMISVGLDDGESFVIVHSLADAWGFINKDEPQMLIVASSSLTDELQLGGFVAAGLGENPGLSVACYRSEPISGIRHVKPGNTNLVAAIQSFIFREQDEVAIVA